MKRFVAAMIFTAGFAGLAPAQAPPPSRLATIHIQSAIASTKQGQQAAQELQTKFTPRRQELERMQSQIAAQQQQMRAGSATMSQAAKDKLTRDIDANGTALKRANEDFTAELQEAEGKVMNDLGQKMMALIGKYAADHSIALVLDVSNPQSPVLWADPSVDITAQIVKQFDEANPAAPAAAPAKPPVPPVTKK